MRRLLPDPAETTVADQVGEPRPRRARRGDDRPYVLTNFALTLDGHATISGRSGAIGSDTDTAMLVGLRTRVDAVMIGAGTMRAERYGRVVGDPAKRERRERDGLAPDPLMVIVSGRLDLPWDAPLFTEGFGRVLIATSSDAEIRPTTETRVEVLRQPDGVDLGGAAHHLRTERGVRALLCEGGPRLHGQLIEAGLRRRDVRHPRAEARRRRRPWARRRARREERPLGSSGCCSRRRPASCSGATGCAGT